MTHTLHAIPCLNCGRTTKGHGRGLCQRCYTRRAIRRRFPVLRPSRGGSLPSLPAVPLAIALQPTPHLPGSEAKMAVLAARFAAGVELFHPLDAAVPEDPPPGRANRPA
jgi:hypothetical protein